MKNNHLIYTSYNEFMQKDLLKPVCTSRIINNRVDKVEFMAKNYIKTFQYYEDDSTFLIFKKNHFFIVNSINNRAITLILQAS